MNIKILMLVVTLLTAAAASARESVGLVLSGGGAKGIAHVGIIKALEENDIPIDYITGTSMGAIVGSLYSCGYSPEKMLQLFTSDEFRSWSTGVVDRSLTYYFTTPAPSPKWFQLNLDFKDSTILQTKILPSSLISPLPMNIGFLELYSQYTKQCGENFNNLFVPFRCVTSDVYHKRKIVCSRGSLANAVRASMTFPLVFKPIKMNGVLVYDGGIYDNFPVDVMRDDFKPDFIIGVSVAGADNKPQVGNIYNQLEDMIIQNNDYTLPEREGVKIQVPVLQFGVLDFQQARTIYEIGYKTGLSMADSIKSRVSARMPADSVARRRERWNSQTPDVEFDQVKVIGATPGQAGYIKYIFDKGLDKPFGISQVRDAYYRAITDGKFSDLVPSARFMPGDSTTLLLNATIKDNWSVGAGGWITSSAHSMLYLTLGYHTLSFNSLDVNFGGWIGQSYYAAMLSGGFELRTHIPSRMEVEAVVSRQKFYDSELLFYQTNTPTFITDHQVFGRVNYSMAAGRKGKAYVSLGGGYLWDTYYQSNAGDFSAKKRDRSNYKTAVLKAGYEMNTLNNLLYPSAGREITATAWGIHERSRLLPEGSEKGAAPYRGRFKALAEVLWREYFPLKRRISIGVMVNGLMSFYKPYENYTATMVNAPAFAPTPSTRNYFNIGFRSPNYLAVGVMPVWNPVSALQIRGDFYGYSPMHNIKEMPDGTAAYGGWFKRIEFIGEIAAVYNFPFASLSVYANYLSCPARNWNFGVSLGLLFQAPRLVK